MSRQRLQQRFSDAFKERFLQTTIACLIMLAAGCAHAGGVWRLSDGVLIPPGVAKAKTDRARVDSEAGGQSCPPELRPRKDRVRMTIRRNELQSRPAGWITAFTEDLESSGCISPGSAARLATDIAESLPLQLNTTFRLLYTDYRKSGFVQLTPGLRLQLVSPILADGTDPEAPLIETPKATLNGNILNVQGRFATSVLGYETSVYLVAARTGAAGVTVNPVWSDRYVDGKVERVALPRHDWFESLRGARSFYELFYKAGETEFTALLLGGDSKADLALSTQRLSDGDASCELLGAARCIPIPKLIGVNPMVSVMINGQEHLLNWGANVGSALRSAGADPNTTLPRLSVQKPFAGRPAALLFSPADRSILDLQLVGGEILSWK